MIVCRSCGHQNVDDAEFCASCRTYLAWDGDRVQAAAPAAPPTPPPPPPAPERRPGLVDQVLGAVRSPGGRGPRPAPEPAAPASGWPAGQTPGAGPAAGGPAPADQQGRHDFPPGPSAYPPGPSAFPPGPSAFPPGPTGPAAAQPGVATAAAGPQAVQPGPEQLLPPAEPTQPAVRRRPGARYCPSCGTENDPDRNLCRSCGAELAVVIARRPPWWRRLFGRSAPSAAAGDRPNRRRRRRSQTARRIFRGTVAGVLITAIVLLAGPFRSNVSRGYHKVKGLVSTQYQPVKAVSASASSAARGHPARNIIDGVKDTAWAEGVRGPGLQESVMINMGRRVDIARIGITPGASDNEKKFRATSRPRQIRVEFSNGRQQVVTLTDTPTFQQFDVSGSGVDHARLVIVATFPGQSAEDTSIAEIEFFSKS